MSTYKQLQAQYDNVIAEGIGLVNNAPPGVDTSDVKASLIDTYNKQNALTSSFKKAQSGLPELTEDSDLDAIDLNSINSAIEKSNSSTLTSTVNNTMSNQPSILSTSPEDITVTAKRNTKIKNQSDRRIKLRPKSGVSSFISNSILMSPLATTNGLIFPFTPRITINHAANYGTQQVTHANQDFKYYTNTPAQSFNISGEFTAQTSDEARYMLGVFHFISTLTKMHSGSNSSTDSGLGLPPPILLLSGFGSYVFNDLPVILTNGTYSYDPSVDLVEVIVNNISNDVPSLCTISLDVTVQNTPTKLRTFNWEKFANGELLSSGGWK